MKEILIQELGKEVGDIPKLTDIIINGKPIYKFGFIRWGYEHIGLFEPYNDGNIFHDLARKGILSIILPVIFSNINKILEREGKNFLEFKQYINAVNKDGLTAAHLAVIHDVVALQKLYEYGAALSRSDYQVAVHKQYKPLESSPLEYIFLRNTEKVEDFFNILLNGNTGNITDLLGLIRSEVDNIIDKISQLSEEDKRSKFSIIRDYSKLLLLDNESVIKLEQLLAPHVLKVQNTFTPTGLMYLHMPFGISGLTNHNLFQKKPITQTQMPFIFSKSLFTGSDSLVIKNAEKSESIKKVRNDNSSRNIIKERPVGKDVQNADISKLLESASDTYTVSAEQEGKVNIERITTTLYAQAIIIKQDKYQQIITLGKSLAKYLREEYSSNMESDLGKSYTDLHAFIFVLYRSKDFFNELIKIVSEQSNMESKSVDTFWTEYIETLTGSDLLEVNIKRQHNAYGMACVLDMPDLVKLLIKKSLATNIYQTDTKGLFDIAIKFGSYKTLKYLLTEQQDIELDWHYILLKAIKYANIQAVEYYIDSGFEIIKTVTDKKGVIIETGKYTILNRALSSLKELSNLKYYPTDEYKKAALKKLPKLCECLEKILKSNKLYCSIQEDIVLNKTFSLLHGLDKNINSLRESNLVSAAEEISRLKDQLLDYYSKLPFLPESIDKRIKLLECVIDYDVLSNATTNVSVISALSDIRDGYEIKDLNSLTGDNIDGGFSIEL
jgi:hypothetical protein